MTDTAAMVFFWRGRACTRPLQIYVMAIVTYRKDEKAMNAISIVKEAMEVAEVNESAEALRIVADSLTACAMDVDAVQGEFDFGGEGADGDADMPDGVKEEKVGDDSVKFTFSFRYAPGKYDSTVDDGARQGDDATVNGGDVAEDAMPAPPESAVAHASAQCKATFEECQAKNPYACKYHGQKLMEADLYALLSANGAKTAKVELKAMTKGSYEAAVTCIDTPAERKAAAKAIKAFLKKKGIDKESTIDTGYDKGEKAHSAFFDVDDLDKDAKSDGEMHVEEEQKEKEPEEKKEEKPQGEENHAEAEPAQPTEDPAGGAGKYEYGFNWNSPTGTEVMVMYNAAMDAFKKLGAEEDASCEAAHKECQDALAATTAAADLIDYIEGALAGVDGNGALSAMGKELQKSVLEKSLELADDASYDVAKKVEKAVKKFDEAVKGYKAKKEGKETVAKAKEAVENAVADVKVPFPYEDGNIFQAAHDHADGIIKGFKEECTKWGVDILKLGVFGQLDLKGKAFKQAAGFFAQTLLDFEKMSGAEHYKPEAILKQAKKVSKAGEGLLSAYKALDIAEQYAINALQAKVKESQDAEAAAAKAAQAQVQSTAAAQQPSSAPADKQAAIKAKVAAMSPKEKVAKAIEILEKKVAEYPGLVEFEEKLAKYKALAAKLG